MALSSPIEWVEKGIKPYLDYRLESSNFLMLVDSFVKDREC